MKLLTFLTILTVCSEIVVASSTENKIIHSGPCVDSFPLANKPTPAVQKDGNHRLLVAIPTDPSRRSYAPLCPDGKRIDIRQLANCNAGSCWEETFQHCTFECTWNVPPPPTPPPTPPPSRQPSPPPTPRPSYGVEETVHAVWLKFLNVPSGYRISQELRSTVLRFVTNILKSNMHDGLELVEVSFASSATAFAYGKRRLVESASSQMNDRRLSYTMYLPLRIVVRGSSDISDFALSYVMEAIRNNQDDLYNYLRSLYGQDMMYSTSMESLAFDFDDVLVESYNFGDLNDMVDPEPAPAPAPAPRPVTVSTRQSVHPVLLTLIDAPDGFRLNKALRDYIIRLVSDVIEKNLGDDYDLISVEYATYASSFAQSSSARGLRRLYDTMYLPLRVTMRGPSNASDNLMSRYVIQAIEESLFSLENSLRSLKSDKFKYNYGGRLVEFDFDKVLVNTYDFDDLSSMSFVQVSSSEGSSWWVWLIVALIIILVCVCCIACSVRRRRDDGKNQEKRVYHVNNDFRESKSRRHVPPPPKKEVRRAPPKARSPPREQTPPSHFDLELDLEEANHTVPPKMKFKADEVKSVISMDVASDPPEQKALILYKHETPPSKSDVDPPEYSNALVLYNPSHAGVEPSVCGYNAGTEPSVSGYSQRRSSKSNQGDDPSTMSSRGRKEPCGIKNKTIYAETIDEMTESGLDDSWHMGEEPRGMKKRSIYTAEVESLLSREQFGEEPRGIKEQSMYMSESSGLNTYVTKEPKGLIFSKQKSRRSHGNLDEMTYTSIKSRRTSAQVDEIISNRIKNKAKSRRSSEEMIFNGYRSVNTLDESSRSKRSTKSSTKKKEGKSSKKTSKKRSSNMKANETASSLDGSTSFVTIEAC